MHYQERINMKLVTPLSHDQKMQVAQNIIDRNNGEKLLSNREYLKLALVLLAIQVVVTIVTIYLG
jgi:hypothetical protein